jgi:hypothetical protein
LCCRTWRQPGLRRGLKIESILTNKSNSNIKRLIRVNQSQGLKLKERKTNYKLNPRSDPIFHIGSDKNIGDKAGKMEMKPKSFVESH